jgi:predicted nucleotidyltransferase
MYAAPLLSKVAKVLAEHRLETVMVGNAAAALHGAPVTTLDIDFMFRKTPTNLKKLKAVASSVGADINFMATLHGIRSFEELRSRATAVSFGGHKLLIATLADIIKSKRAAGRPRDKAVLDILEKTLEQQQDDKESA